MKLFQPVLYYSPVGEACRDSCISSTEELAWRACCSVTGKNANIAQGSRFRRIIRMSGRSSSMGKLMTSVGPSRRQRTWLFPWVRGSVMVLRLVLCGDMHGAEH